MKYREIGNSGINASVVAFGAWAIGGWMWGGTEEQESINAVNAAIENSINFIDTAPVYGYGVSEEIVGKAIKDKTEKIQFLAYILYQCFSSDVVILRKWPGI